MGSEMCIRDRMKTGGFELWLDVIAGDPKAQAKMERYNGVDVRRTEQVYTHFRPDLPGTANLALWASGEGAELACPNCGSKRRVGVPDSAASQTKYGTYRCRSCGTVFRASFIKHRVSTRVAR